MNEQTDFQRSAWADAVKKQLQQAGATITRLSTGALQIRLGASWLVLNDLSDMKAATLNRLIHEAI